MPLPPGPVESNRARLGPTALAAAVGLLVLTRRPGRSADLIKALTPKAAVQDRDSFAATLDLLMCRRGALPMDGSAYRRLDRVDAVVVGSCAPVRLSCSGRTPRPLAGTTVPSGRRRQACSAGRRHCRERGDVWLGPAAE